MYLPQYIIMFPSQDQRVTDETIVCPMFLSKEEKSIVVEPSTICVVDGPTNGYNL